MRTLTILAIVAILVVPAMGYNWSWPGNAMYWVGGNQTGDASILLNNANWQYQFDIGVPPLYGTAPGTVPPAGTWGCIDNANLNITSGNINLPGVYFMGSNPLDVSSLTLSGQGTRINFTDTMFGPDAGSGTFTINAGAEINIVSIWGSGIMAPGYMSGNLLVDVNAGGRLISNTGGQINIGHNGPGTLLVGGVVETASRMWIGNGGNPAPGLVVVENGGSLVITEGGNTYSSQVLLGNAVGAVGTVRVEAGGTFKQLIPNLGGGYGFYMGNQGTGQLETEIGCSVQLTAELKLGAYGGGIGSAWDVEVNGSASGSIRVEGNVSLANGNLVVSGAGLGSASWALLIDGSATTTYTGSFASITAGYSVVVDANNNLLLIPEPATMCLLGLGALGLLRRRR